MTSEPVDVSISRQTIPGQVEIVCVEVKDGPKSIVRLEFAQIDFLTALVSGQTVMAAMERGGK